MEILLREINRVRRSLERLHAIAEETQAREFATELAQLLELAPGDLPWSGYAHQVAELWPRAQNAPTAGKLLGVIARWVPAAVQSHRDGTGVRFFISHPDF
jgi:hypothetical protein